MQDMPARPKRIAAQPRITARRAADPMPTWKQIGVLADLLPAALIIHDLARGESYENRRLRDWLAADPESVRVEAAAMALIEELKSPAQTELDRPYIPELSSAALRCITTAQGHYRLSGSTQRLDRRSAMALVVVERQSGTPSEAREVPTIAKLTAAELRVAARVACGHSSKKIAAALGLSWHTVRRHTESVFRKVGVRTRAELAYRLVSGFDAADPKSCRL